MFIETGSFKIHLKIISKHWNLLKWRPNEVKTQWIHVTEYDAAIFFWVSGNGKKNTMYNIRWETQDRKLYLHHDLIQVKNRERRPEWNELTVVEGLGIMRSRVIPSPSPQTWNLVGNFPTLPKALYFSWGKMAQAQAPRSAFSKYSVCWQCGCTAG